MMFDAEKLVLVLWGNRFDEAIAAICVSELRRLGWIVRVVGLTGRAIRGYGGMGVQPDIMLESARRLLSEVSAVIIPCDLPTWQNIHNDPRLREFLTELRQSKMLLVVSASVAESPEMQDATAAVMAYPGLTELPGFLRHTFDLPPQENL